MRNFARLLVIALILSCPAAVIAKEALPSGFVAVSETKMNLTAAQKFCAEKGGRLPYVGGGADALSETPPGTPVEGFGVVGDPWPDSLPKVYYWTGTGSTLGKKFAYVITSSRNKVDAISSGADPDDKENVLCLPK